ncbi:uncharacterized protein LOC126681626 [Mercurialis annua]|uniref:uncharacterized protein LOC126681626 n=1 Tax=Mercurialis annua TaxID=3986 RepID=UPI00215DFA70|nr:uncharacterized protein LOC126681626 [Mercurialis annua]
MALFLPRFVVLRSNNDKYLRYVRDGKLRNLIKCDGQEIISPVSKFKIEKAKSHRDLVHIRCCYTNKYLRRRDEEALTVGATADAADEDQSKWSCTLFKLLPVDDKTFHFRHVESGCNLYQWRSTDDYDGCLFIATSDDDEDARGSDLFSFTDWESLVILPKHVVFKGDNGKYLRYRGNDSDDGDDHMEFGCDDIGSIKLTSEPVTNYDGSVCFKLDYNEKFWEATPNWIFPTSANPKTWFRPVKLAPVSGKDNIIALKCLGNDKFCRRTDYDGTVDCLAAATWASTIDKEANLQVEEPILNREVYDVSFRLDDMRVYKEQVLVLASDETTNMTGTEIKDSELSLAYEDTKTSSYANSLSVQTSIEMGFEANIPLLEGALSLGVSSSFSIEYGEKYSWAETKSKTNQLSAVIKVVVPPKTRVKVDLVATKGFCDVPFSYAQRDTLTSGQQFTYIKDDGVYTGSNYFGFNFVVKEEPLAG